MAQVWLVTGSSRGLGRAIVEAGLAAGNKVLATARDIESLHDLSERHGDEIKFFALDVTDESAAASAVKAGSAFDIRMMFQGYLERGFAAEDGDVETVTKLLGHPPRRYEEFARETVPEWQTIGKAAAALA
jgi:NAD(P)-dependent dehydrogenase (short-subunit alcohol dehydrogenase family)